MINFEDFSYYTPASTKRDLNEWLSNNSGITIINIETLMQTNTGTRGNQYLKAEYIRVWYSEKEGDASEL